MTDGQARDSGGLREAARRVVDAYEENTLRREEVIDLANALHSSQGAAHEVAEPAGREDFVAIAQRIRSEHEAAHGEAEMCGAECIVLGLADFDDDSAPDEEQAAPESLREALERALRDHFEYDHRPGTDPSQCARLVLDAFRPATPAPSTEGERGA